MKSNLQLGLERCLEQLPKQLMRGARVGLLMNQASVDRSFRYACDLLANRFPGQLALIFSPQHGLWCEQQANMVESPHSLYEPLDLPVYSLYSETRRPTPDMLASLDCVVIDLQDVGTRVYTFIWTVRECLLACRDANIPVIILDRPNPIGGAVAEGSLLEPGLESFVGGASIPLRHGLTLGELARLINAEQKINAALEVVPLTGWHRSSMYHDNNRGWVAPSPNMPKARTALLYPGQVLLEGTNLSEGRGTAMPFEVCGAPFIDPHALAADLNSAALHGIVARPLYFVPTFDKWIGQRCGGVEFHVTNAKQARPVLATLHLLAAVKRRYPYDFAWLPPPYEYEHEKMPIDILFGSSKLREAFMSEIVLSDATINELALLDEAAWWVRVQPYLLYD